MTDNNRLMSVENVTHKGKILHVYCMCMHGTDFINFISGRGNSFYAEAGLYQVRNILYLTTTT